MPHRLLRRLALSLVLLGAIAALVGLGPGTAHAHNSLLSSDPADGATVAAAPAQVLWTFDKSVPLETITVTLIDATGVRSELSGSTHGVADTEVVTPLPVLTPGEVSLRWRLVGPDGHPITGRVDFTITAPPATTQPATGAPGAVPPPAGAPTATNPAPATTVPPADAATDAGDEDGGATPSLSSPMRWLLRYGSYLAIMYVVGLLWIARSVWSGALRHPLLRQLLKLSLIVTGLLGFVQLLVIAGDITGDGALSSFGSLSAATTTDAGMALAVRILLAAAMWILLFLYQPPHRDAYWTGVAIAAIGLLGTWAAAGHSHSMRWPEIGVVADVAHHASAAVWIAGLAIVGLIVIPTARRDVLVPAVRRFSRIAAASVAVLVGTGLIQAVRLVGSPVNLLDGGHGRYLVVKVVALAAMLGVANVNRQRVSTRLDDDHEAGLHVAPLQRAMAAELAIGLVIVGITAAMVVSPPATGDAAGRVPDDVITSVNYTM